MQQDEPKPVPQQDESKARQQQDASKSEPQQDESKLKPQRFSLPMKWVAGVTLSMLGLGAWSYITIVLHGHMQSSASWRPPAASNIPAIHSEGLAAVVEELPQGPESLEAALNSLESGEAWGSHGIHLPESSIEPPAAAAKPKAGKSSKKAKAKRVAKEPEGPDMSSATGVKAKAIVDDILGRFAPRKEAKAPPAANPEMDEALEKLERGSRKEGKRSKKSTSSDPDKEKAEAIIQEYLEKMRSSPAPPEEDMDRKTLKERLEALVAENPEADQHDDIRKAKSIIKDAMKKMKLTDDAGKASKSQPEAEDEALDGLHMEFAKRLQEEKQAKPLQDMASVRQEFKSEFGDNSRRLLCSGCKLVAARMSSELSNHDVHDAESPAAMLASKRRAIDATCRSFRHIHVREGVHGPVFAASEAVDEPEENAAPRLGQRLCSALLEDAKFDVLTKLMQRKIPANPFGQAEAPSAGNNWERLLCAQRARVCKRNEVRDEDDDEEL